MPKAALPSFYILSTQKMIESFRQLAFLVIWNPEILHIPGRHKALSLRGSQIHRINAGKIVPPLAYSSQMQNPEGFVQHDYLT